MAGIDASRETFPGGVRGGGGAARGAGGRAGGGAGILLVALAVKGGRDSLAGAPPTG